MTYLEAVKYKNSLLSFGIKLGLERFSVLLEGLGNPHLSFPSVHIAGTNGKGSTSVFISTILERAGFKTGRYMSPHLFDLGERISVNNQMIPEADFARIVSVIKPVIEEIATQTGYGETTEFELLTAVAFVYFAEQKIEIAVLEVGLGGRFDATNVIPPPLLAVITRIGLDHQIYLGDTVGKIAFEKAGIVKKQTGYVVTSNQGEALEVIEQKARACKAEVYPYSKLDFSARGLGPQGYFQTENASLAVCSIEALRSLGWQISDDAILKGLKYAQISGRFQVSEISGRTFVLDVAHNQDAAEVLALSLESKFPGRTFDFIIGMTSGHEARPFLEKLKPFIQRVFPVTPNFRPQPAQNIIDACTELSIQVMPEATLETAISESGSDLVITGSFYVVGDVPKWLR